MKTAEALELMTQKQMFWTRLRQLTIRKRNDNIENEADWETETFTLSDFIRNDNKLEGHYLENFKKDIIENNPSEQVVT